MQTTFWCEGFLPWGYSGAGRSYPTCRHPVVPALCAVLNPQSAAGTARILHDLAKQKHY